MWSTPTVRRKTKIVCTIGMMSFLVKSKTEDSVKCEVVDGGELKSRRHLNVRGKSATLPSITEKDWDDIKFGVDNKVDFYAWIHWHSKRIAANNADGSTQDHRLGSLYTTLAAGKIILILCFAKSKTQKIGTAAVSVMQARGVGLIFAHSGDNQLDPCVLIPCNNVGHKFFLTSEKQVFQLQSLDIPRVLKGNGYLQTIHKLLPFSSTGPSSMSQAVLKVYMPSEPEVKGHYCYKFNRFLQLPSLIKSAHQDWSPDAIRSALVTSTSQIETDGMNVFEEGPTLLQSYSQRSRPVRHGW
ncbi:hypothetical protein LWI29_029168 [Acer saccharum]|uniref:Pyruvate kinase barrel domain-containing protein n=1 Tax=Acer saccharum TaxID=4024 RepID=A0AA39VT48_ACESA|nr:hypothetical protein LWI29_029168 [Acer saccharum]